jgi:hypothetical protein
MFRGPFAIKPLQKTALIPYLRAHIFVPCRVSAHHHIRKLNCQRGERAEAVVAREPRRTSLEMNGRGMFRDA